MTIAADAVPPLLSDDLLQAALLAYDLPQPITVRLLRRGYNDHYLVTAGGQPFILRVYLNHKPYLRGAHDFQAEVDVLTTLKAHGVRVSAPLVRRDGTRLGRVADPQGDRYVAVFEYAQGNEVSSGDVSEVDAAHIGRTLATLHATADELHLGQDRPRLDATLLIDQPVAALQRLLGRDADFLGTFADKLKRQWALLPQEAGTFGYIHGDVHLGQCPGARARLHPLRFRPFRPRVAGVRAHGSAAPPR